MEPPKSEASGDKKKLKKLEKRLEERDNALELEARGQDAARALKKSSMANQALIEASKPKAKKQRQADQKKIVKTARAAEVREAKLVAKQTKAAEKAEAKAAKAAEKAVAKAAKAANLAMEELDPDPLPWQEWRITGHAISEVDLVTPFFKVAMHGLHPKEGEKETWCQRKDLVADKATTLIDEYIRTKADYAPYNDLLVSKQKPRKVAQKKTEVLDKSSPCRHDDYRVSFNMEDHPGFCAPGQYLHSLKCGGTGCERTFVSTLKEAKPLGKDKSSRPTADKPVYCCVNIEKGSGAYRQHSCKHALCNPCWAKAVLGEDSESGTAVARVRRGAARAVMVGYEEV